jgi:hypothetical protein
LFVIVLSGTIKSISYHGSWLPIKENRANNDGKEGNLGERNVLHAWWLPFMFTHHGCTTRCPAAAAGGGDPAQLLCLLGPLFLLGCTRGTADLVDRLTSGFGPASIICHRYKYCIFTMYFGVKKIIEL